MVESQDSLYNMDSQDFNLSAINTDDLLSSPELEDTMMNLSPNSFPELPKLMQDATPMDYNGACHNYSVNQDLHFYQPILVEPAHLSNLPVLDPVETDWCFNIELNSESASKTSWMFSTKLNKVFVKINTFLNVHARYENVDPDQELFLRAMIVYSSPNEIADPVKKCPNHRSQPNQDFPEHILRCEVRETEYVGVETGKLFKDKLALLVPMNAVASNEPLKLIFTCQNSCSGGMNRKMTSIVFTLENIHRELLGRKVMNFKVCSCPKRDKDKDEESITKTLPKKRKSESALPSTSKKVAIQVPIQVKQENDNSLSPATIPEAMLTSTPSDLLQSLIPGLMDVKKEPQNCEVTLIMPNPEYKQQVLQYAYDILAGGMIKTGASYDRYLSDIQKKMDDNL